MTHLKYPLYFQQSATFREQCGDVKDFAGCVASLPGNIAGDFNGIANGGAPTTQNKLAFPTLFKLWQDM